MKWKTNLPKDGDTRIEKYYAFLPTVLTNGWTVWLEEYFAEEKCVYWQANDQFTWTTVRTWIDVQPEDKSVK